MIQRMEREEVERETGVYAGKSFAEEISSASEGLAMEQLVLLREEESGIDCNRFLGKGERSRRKPAPLKTKGCGTPLQLAGMAAVPLKVTFPTVEPK
jgi:hypothetical protein